MQYYLDRIISKKVKSGAGRQKTLERKIPEQTCPISPRDIDHRICETRHRQAGA